MNILINKGKVIAVLVVIMTTLFTCSSKVFANTFEDEKSNYQASFPSDWIIDSQQGGDVVTSSPELPDEYYAFIQIISGDYSEALSSYGLNPVGLTTKDLLQDLTPYNYWEIIEPEYEAKFGIDLELKDSGTKLVDGKTSGWLKYKTKGIEGKGEVYYLLVNNRFYIISTIYFTFIEGRNNELVEKEIKESVQSISFMNSNQLVITEEESSEIAFTYHLINVTIQLLIIFLLIGISSWIWKSTRWKSAKSPYPKG